MDGILLLIVICMVIEVYFIIIGINLIFEMYYYYKDGNKKDTNLKGRMLRSSIRHELVHARIANMFGFTDWKIITKNNSLACRIEIDYDTLNWKTIFNFLKMCIFHLIYDVGDCIVWVDVIGVCEYIQTCFLDIKIIISKFIENKKLVNESNYNVN